MNVIYKITLKNLLQHKGRTLLGLIGIIVAIAAFTGVSTLGSSTKDMMIRQEKKLYLDWHIGVRNMSKEEQKEFEQLSGLTELDYYKSYGYATIPHAEGKMPYVYLEGLQDRELSELKQRLKVGRLPQNEDEIVVSDALLNSIKDPWQIGDRISLSIGQRVKTKEQKQWEKDTYVKNMEVYGDWYQKASAWNWSPYFEGEILKDLQKKTFTIVGVISEFGSEQLNGYSPLGYDTFTKWEPQNKNQWEQGISVRAKFKNKKSFFKTVDLLKNKKNETSLKERVFYNTNLLSTSYRSLWDRLLLGDNVFSYFNDGGWDYYSNDLQLIQLMKIGLYLVIMISAILFIYNIFAISLAERRKYLGIIASIGATERQKRSSMYFESFFMMIIALPIGILSGVLGIKAVVYVIKDWVQDIFNVSVPFRMVISWEAVIGIVLLTFISIYLSAFLTLKKAGKITPIEAIRRTKEYKIKRQRKGKGAIAKHFFGMEGKLAVKNGARNKGTKTVIFSMVVTLLLFIGISTYMKYTKESTDNYGESNYDIMIHNLDIERGNQVMPKLNQMESIQEATQVIAQTFWFTKTEKDDLVGTIISFDKEYEKSYWKQVTGQEVENIQWKKGDPIPAIVIPTYNVYMDDNVYKDWEIGKQYEIRLESKTGDGYRQKTVELVGISGVAPKGWYQKKDGVILKNDTVGNENLILIPRSIANQITQKVKEGEHSEWYNDIYISANGDVEQAKKEIQTLSWSFLSGEVKPMTDSNYRAHEEKMKNVQMILFSGYIVLVTIICALNIMNLMNNKMEVRRREMAMLSSIGMTQNGISKMLFIESMLYSVKSILISIPFIVVIQLFMFLAFSDGGRWINGHYEHASPLIPWVSMILGCIGLVLVSAGSFLYAYSKIKDDNMIEQLKVDS